MQKSKNIVIAVVLAWLIPGAGHYYLEKKGKAIVFFALLTLTFLSGMAMANFRNVSFREPLYFFAYFWLGSITIIAFCTTMNFSIVPIFYPYAYQLGCLYSTVASILNIFLILHVLHLAARPVHKEQVDATTT